MEAMSVTNDFARAWASGLRKVLTWGWGVEMALLVLALLNSLEPSEWVAYGSDPWWVLYFVRVVVTIFIATVPGLVIVLWCTVRSVKSRSDWHSLRAWTSVVGCVALCVLTLLACAQVAKCGGALAGIDGDSLGAWFRFLGPGLDMAVPDKTVFYVVPLTAASVLVTEGVGYGGALLTACAGDGRPERESASNPEGRPSPWTGGPR